MFISSIKSFLVNYNNPVKVIIFILLTFAFAISSNKLKWVGYFYLIGFKKKESVLFFIYLILLFYI